MKDNETRNAEGPDEPLVGMLFGHGTPRKAGLTALVVGTVLTGINHGDLILAGESPPMLKVMLTYCVPYCVTTWGAITGKRAMRRETARRTQGQAGG